MTLTTRASVPTPYRSSKVGSMVSGDRWVTTPTSARSWPTRSSTTRTLRGRPTLIGTTDMGKRTAFRSGRIVMRSLGLLGRASDPIETTVVRRQAASSVAGRRTAKADLGRDGRSRYGTPPVARVPPYRPLGFALLASLGTPACHPHEPSSPRDVLVAYAHALEA